MPILILNPPATTDPPFRSVFLVLGSVACGFAMLLSVGSIRAARQATA